MKLTKTSPPESMIMEKHIHHQKDELERMLDKCKDLFKRELAKIHAVTAKLYLKPDTRPKLMQNDNHDKLMMIITQVNE